MASGATAMVPSQRMDHGARFHKCALQIHIPRDSEWSGEFCTVVSTAERALYANSLTEHEGVVRIYQRRGEMDEAKRRGFYRGDHIYQRFDSDGRVIEELFKYPGGEQLEKRSTTSYGPDGFESEVQNYLNGRLTSIERLTYETDENGNWIKKVTMSHDAGDAEAISADGPAVDEVVSS